MIMMITTVLPSAFDDALSNRFLQLTSHSQNSSTWLSIQYSLPPFLTKSLLSQYGYERAKQICILTNRPGPITLRRNAIRFPRTDDELCNWLMEEDGIDVRRLHWEEDKFSFGLGMIASSDGSDNYVVGGSSSGPGTVGPPNGAMQLMNDKPLTAVDTTVIEQRRKSIWSTKGWKNGYFEVQDAGSQVIVQSLEVVPGMSILDYCAGNGGKTLGLASSIMANAAAAHHDSGEGQSNYYSKIVAHDVVEERLRQIEGSMARAGFVAIHSSGSDGKMDGRRQSYIAQNNHSHFNCTIEITASTDLSDGYVNSSSLPSRFFNAVLVDAPCSSTGVLRRRPSQRWDLSEEQIYDALPKLQLEILERAASFVREDGGRLVYSTCSLLREENECVAKMFESSDIFMDGGFERWDFVPIDMSNDIENCGVFSKGRSSHSISILPSESGSDGFFIARWRRVRNAI